MRFPGIASCLVIASEVIDPWSYSLKMGRIDAGTHAAEVINVEPYGNWAFVRFVKEAVRPTIPGQLAVPVGLVDGPLPYPATGCVRLVAG
jgi:hypothetical protein